MSRDNGWWRKGVAVSGLSVFVLCAVVTARLAEAAHYPPYWESTLGGVYLQAWTEQVQFPTSTTWSNRAHSQSSQYIDRIGVTNYGNEYCNGATYTRWTDPRTYYNSYYSAAGGSARSYTCTYSHDYCPLSSHDFYRSGSFGANPYTMRGSATYC
jgi:hypothetical protein